MKSLGPSKCSGPSMANSKHTPNIILACFDYTCRRSVVAPQGSPASGVLDRQLPAIAVGVVEPEAVVRRPRCLRPDLVAGVLEVHPVLFQLLERRVEFVHAGQMKRHVVDRFRMRLAP